MTSLADLAAVLLVVATPLCLLAAAATALAARAERPRARGWHPLRVVAVALVGGIVCAAVWLAPLTAIGPGGNAYPTASAGALACSIAVTMSAAAKARHVWAGAVAAATWTWLGLLATWLLVLGLLDDTGFALLGMLVPAVVATVTLPIAALVVATFRTMRPSPS